MTLTSQVSATFDYPAPLDLFHAWYRVRYYSSQINTKKVTPFEGFLSHGDPISWHICPKSKWSVAFEYLIDHQISGFIVCYEILHDLLLNLYFPPTLEATLAQEFCSPLLRFLQWARSQPPFSLFNIFKIKVTSFK